MGECMSMLDAALAAANKGFRVFPVGANSKTPILACWPQLATRDETTIREWWSGNFKTKTKKGREFKIPADANIGICPGDDFVIVDVDTDITHGSSGVAELNKLIAEGLPKTFTVKTTSGGLHLYYKHPAGKLDVPGYDTSYVKSIGSWRQDDQTKPSSGIDVRGNKGQGIFVGSLIDGVPYTLQTDMDPVDLPDTIACQLPFKKARAANDFDIGNVPDHLKAATLVNDRSLETSSASKYSEFPDVIKMGSRDHTLFAYACSWRQRGYPTHHAQALMKELWSRCEQGSDELTLEDAFEKIERAYNTYEAPPSADWTEVTTATGVVVEAQAEHVLNLQEALKRFMYVEQGDRVADISRHPQFGILKLNEFKNSFRNVTLEFTPSDSHKVQKVPLPEVWMKHKFRLTVRDVGYHPLPPATKELPSTYKYMGEELYNLWRGSALKLPETIDPGKCEIFMEHMRYMFNNDEESMGHFLDWIAYTVRYPQERIQHAVLMIGSHGTGKGWFYKVLELMLGAQNVSVVGNQDLESDFNTWVSQRTLAVIDDITPTNGVAMWDKIKSEITELVLEINRKYGGKGKERVFANILIFSNHADAIAINRDERRLWVYLSKVKRRSDEYYIRLFSWLKTDGPAHLMKAFMSRDLSKFNPGMLPPMTRAKSQMYEANQSIIEQLITDGIADSEGCFVGDIVCASLVEQFVLTRVADDKLDAKTQRMIRRLLVSLVGPLPQDRYRVPGKSNALRLKCIRNGDKWSEAGQEEIGQEYIKARDASITRVGGQE